MKPKTLTLPLCAAQMTRFTLLVTMGFLLAGHGEMRAASTGTAVQKPLTAESVRAAAKEGRIAFRLTIPEELEAMLGKPQNKSEDRKGDVVVQVLEFPGVTATFGRFGEFAGPFTLFELQVGGQPVDIGRDRQRVLRTVDDLGRLDSFWGLVLLCYVITMLTSSNFLPQQ